MRSGLLIRHGIIFLCACFLCACSGENSSGEITSPEQTTHDTVDYDGNNEPILTELQVDGEVRKVLIQANRNGFFYVLDRTNGEFIGANPFVEKVTWADGLDSETGRPSRSRSIQHMLETGEPTEIWPTALGAKNLAPMSYSPVTGLAYVNAICCGG